MSAGAGTVIGGRFMLLALLGKGAMGRVWLAHDQTLDREVAVKEVLLPPDLPEEDRPALLARTRREGRAAARLNHPGVVTIHDVVEHDEIPWIVMEHVPGTSLRKVLEKEGPLPWRRVAEIGAKVADALAHAHDAGIVHRDLKPDNVLIAGDRAVITDFGIARILDAASRMTSTGMIMGTTAFMAPEQLEGSRVGPSADMWSLGVMLYLAVEGRRPFDGPTGTALITAILARDPLPARHAGPLTGLLSQLLLKDSAHRPTATAAAGALQAAAASQTSPVTPTQPAIPQPVAPAPTVTQSPPAYSAANGLTPGPAAVLAPQPAIRPRQGPAPRPPALPPPGQGGGLIIAGLLMSLAAMALVFWSWHWSWNSADRRMPHAAGMVIFVAVGVLALVSLIAPRVRMYGASFVLGVWTVAIPTTALDVIRPLGGGASSDTVPVLAAGASDIAGIATVVILVVALVRACGQGHWLVPRALSKELFVSVLLSSGIVQAWGFSPWSLDQISWILGALMVIVVIVAVLAGAYALRLQNRVAGGALLLGLSVPLAMGYANAGGITLGLGRFHLYPQPTGIEFPIEFFCLLTCAVFALRYMTRRA